MKIVPLQFLLLIGLIAGLANGSHFRAGLVTWSTNPNNNMAVDFSLTISFRASYFSGVAAGNTIYTGSPFYFGDGAYAIVSLYVTSYNSADDWFSGTWTYTYTYGSTGSFVATFQDCCRVSFLQNNHDQYWSVSTSVLISATAVYSAPSSTVLPIVPIVMNQPASFSVPASSSMTGHSIVYSLATSQQMIGSSGGIQPPGITVDANTGLVSLPNGLSQGYWSAQIIITDTTNGIYVAADFLINAQPVSKYCASPCNILVSCASNSDCTSCNPSSSCTAPVPRVITNSISGAQPNSNSPTPAAGSTLSYTIDDTISINIIADDPVFGGSHVLIYAAGLPIGAQLSQEADCSSTAGCNCNGCNAAKVVQFTWTPTYNDIGDNSVCFGVRSFTNELTYSQHCFTLRLAAMSCPSGFADCNGVSSDGCETDLTQGPTCGSCTPCSAPHVATYSCTLAGRCAIATCSATYGDCDGVFSNGCEANVNQVTNCGTCGHTCSLPNVATHSCSSGSCGIVQCTTGYLDCNNDPTDGCEYQAFVGGVPCSNCGCPANVGNYMCTISSCSAGHADCNTFIADGCEIDTTSNTLNCGTCSNVCSVSNGDAGCSAGTCTVNSCSAPFDDCNNIYSDGCETDTSSSITNCGTCGHTCSLPNVATHSCSSGSCGIVQCSAGFGDCNNDPTDGCETDLTSSASNCGSCRGACSASNANGYSCSASTCSITSCSDNYFDCNAQYADGCESLFIPTQTKHSVIYDETVDPSFTASGSTGTYSLTNSYHHIGAVSATFTPAAGTALKFSCASGSCINTTATATIGFWASGGRLVGGNQQINFNLYSGNAIARTITINPSAFVQGAWTHYYVPLVTSSFSRGLFSGFSFTGSIATAQLPVYLDQINLIKNQICP